MIEPACGRREYAAEVVVALSLSLYIYIYNMY